MTDRRVFVYGEAMPAWRIAGFALVWVGLAMITVDALRNRTTVLEPA